MTPDKSQGFLLSSLRLAGLRKSLRSLPLRLSHGVRSSVQSLKERFPRTWQNALLTNFFRNAIYNYCDDRCIDAIPSFPILSKQVARFQIPSW